MLDRPRPLLGLALLALAGLWWLQASASPPSIAPADAARHEGQAVRTAGVVVEARTWGDGFRLDIARDGHALAVAVTGNHPAPSLGAWVEAEGRLARQGGLLVLRADRLDAAHGPAPERPAWGLLADDPAAWTGRPLRIEGTVARGELRDGNGHALRLGDGPWPQGGAVAATGAIAYDASCVCHRFHAARVEPWTP